MRTSAPSPTEIAAFNKFAQDYDIITAGEVGVRNADILCTPIINSEFNSELTPRTLTASLLNVKSRIQFKSATYKKADDLARALSPDEQGIYRNWASHQKLLVGLDGSPEGVMNVFSLLSWMRGNPVSSHNLDLALGNLINNPMPGQRIHFHPQPKQQDRSVVQGRPNHAFGAVEEPKVKAATIQQREYINGRRNHGYIPLEEAVKKVSVQAPDAWQQICQLHLKEWVTPGQRAKLEGEYEAGIATGKSWRDIGTSLAAIIRDQQRGR
jgi:hypothetical protein